MSNDRYFLIINGLHSEIFKHEKFKTRIKKLNFKFIRFQRVSETNYLHRYTGVCVYRIFLYKFYED